MIFFGLSILSTFLTGPPAPESGLLDSGTLPPPEGGEVLLLSKEVSVFVDDLFEGSIFSSPVILLSWSPFLLPRLPTENLAPSTLDSGVSFFISVIDPKFEVVTEEPSWKESSLGMSADLDLLWYPLELELGVAVALELLLTLGSSVETIEGARETNDSARPLGATGSNRLDISPLQETASRVPPPKLSALFPLALLKPALLDTEIPAPLL